MKFLIAVVLTMVLGWLSGLILPFWSLSASALVVGFLVNPAGNKALPAGMLSGALLWGSLAWRLDVANDRILSTRVAILFELGPDGIIAATALLGAILAGLGMLVGDRARTAVKEPTRQVNDQA